MPFFTKNLHLSIELYFPKCYNFFRVTKKKEGDVLLSKYPIVLVHGILAKQMKLFNAFGKIGDVLQDEGYQVYIADIDGFGSVEGNAEQLKRFINKVKLMTGCEKVNIIAHSKGGLDSKYMITHLGMEDSVASLTTLCTPHRGSIIASKIWSLPMPIKKIIAFCIDMFYCVICGDEHPDSMRACQELRSSNTSEDTLQFSYKVYCQSYSTTIGKAKDCFIMALPMKLQHHYEVQDNDGLVSEESAQFGCYRGKCLDIPVSHIQIIDLFSKKEQKEQIYSFYKQVCKELSEMGF